MLVWLCSLDWSVWLALTSTLTAIHQIMPVCWLCVACLLLWSLRVLLLSERPIAPALILSSGFLDHACVLHICFSGVCCICCFSRAFLVLIFILMIGVGLGARLLHYIECLEVSGRGNHVFVARFVEPFFRLARSFFYFIYLFFFLKGSPDVCVCEVSMFRSRFG